MDVKLKKIISHIAIVIVLGGICFAGGFFLREAQVSDAIVQIKKRYKDVAAERDYLAGIIERQGVRITGLEETVEQLGRVLQEQNTILDEYYRNVEAGFVESGRILGETGDILEGAGDTVDEIRDLLDITYSD